MVRVAVCLSGQPRRALDTYSSIYKYIIEPNKADVFIHMNYDNNGKNIEKLCIDRPGEMVHPSDIDIKVLELYKPIRYVIEPPKNGFNPNIQIPESRLDELFNMNKAANMSREQIKVHCVKQLISMYYSIFKSNELKEVYANENGFVYDYVIRIRFDACPSKPLICSEYNPNFIYYQELGQPDNLISDWLNFGSNSIMNIYSSMYIHMEYINSFKFFTKLNRYPNTLQPSDICSGFCEFMIRDIMTLFNITKAPIDVGLTLYY